jgi:hypothetical protein
MATDLQRYAQGLWLTPRLMTVTAAMSLTGMVIVVVALFATRSGTVDAMGRPLGTDFLSFWSAGRLALDGVAPHAYDWSILRETQHQAHGGDAFFPWSYPPLFLLVAAALALLPYIPALILWQVSTLLAALAAFRMVLPSRLALLAGLGCPIVFVCLGNGQTGFLTAALFLGGLLALRRQEALAGVLFGLLAYKPQFGLLIPLALVAGGHWRAIVSAGVTVCATVALTLALWGWPVWQAFLTSLQMTQAIVLDQGGPGFEKFQSVFAWVRLWGGAVPLAYGLQGLVAAAVAIGCWRIWRRGFDLRLKAAALLVGALLSTPYVLDYDFVVLGMALAFLVSYGLDHGFLPWEKTALALSWLLSGSARALATTLGLPIGLVVLIGVFGFVIAHARTAKQGHPRRHDPRPGA